MKRLIKLGCILFSMTLSNNYIHSQGLQYKNKNVTITHKEGLNPEKELEILIKNLKTSLAFFQEATSKVVNIFFPSNDTSNDAHKIILTSYFVQNIFIDLLRFLNMPYDSYPHFISDIAIKYSLPYWVSRVFLYLVRNNLNQDLEHSTLFGVVSGLIVIFVSHSIHKSFMKAFNTGIAYINNLMRGKNARY